MDEVVQHVNPELFAGVYLKEKKGEKSNEESKISTFEESKVQMRRKPTVKIVVKVVINIGFSLISTFVLFFCLFVCLFVVVELLLLFFGQKAAEGQYL